MGPKKIEEFEKSRKQREPAAEGDSGDRSHLGFAPRENN